MVHMNCPLGSLGWGAAVLLTVAVMAGLPTGVSAQANPYTMVQDVQTGEVLFGRQCSTCHGVGAGGGEMGPDLTTGDFEHSSTDAGLFNTISEGVPGTAMTGINRTRTDQTVWQLVAYLRSISGGERVAVAGDASAGERLYRGEWVHRLPRYRR